MRRVGRVSPLFLGVLIGVVALVGILFFGQRGPAEVGTQFMDALARGDVDQLTKTSYVSGKSEDQLREEWKFATQVAAKHYVFRWKVSSAHIVDDKTADVRLQVERNFGPGSYEENYGLTLNKIDGNWKVDASGISREMYPGLPRPGKG